MAVMHRSGDLTAVWVPDEVHEAMRDLVRARMDATMQSKRARQQLLAFLLRSHVSARAKTLDEEALTYGSLIDRRHRRPAPDQTESNRSFQSRTNNAACLRTK